MDAALPSQSPSCSNTRGFKLTLPLLSAFVRPHLEYCLPACSPNTWHVWTIYSAFKDCLQFWWLAFVIFPTNRDCSLYSVQWRRVCAGLRVVFKIFTFLCNVNWRFRLRSSNIAMNFRSPLLRILRVIFSRKGRTKYWQRSPLVSLWKNASDWTQISPIPISNLYLHSTR